MKKVIVYCHGYGSSPESDKLLQLKDAGFDAYCFQADIDPDIAHKSICDKIDSMLLDYLHQDIKLIFVGTSLGGWMASNLADCYSADAIIINPSHDPKESLAKYGVSEEIRNKYTPLVANRHYVYFFGENDEVIDHSLFTETLVGKCRWFSYKGADHRFKGHFHHVIDYLKSI